MFRVKDTLNRFLFWRITLFLVAIPAIFFLPFRSGFSYFSEDYFGKFLLHPWTNFDGVSFLNHATLGHGLFNREELLSTTFPVYPWLIDIVNGFFQNYIYSGLVISNLAFFLSLVLLYKLLLLDYKEKITRFTIFLILIFPTSFFFGSLYPESLFLLLTLASFYFARKKMFLLACLMAAVASATKIAGIFLWPALLLEFYHANGSKLKAMLRPELIWFSLPPLGLISFIRYQMIYYGDSLFSIPSQYVERLILLHQVFYRYLAMIIRVDHTDPLFFTIVLEFVIGLGFLLLLLFSLKKIRPSYWLYSFLSFILPTFSGTFCGLPRYVIVLFPLFGYLGVVLDKFHPYLRYFYYLTSIIFSLLAISLFVRGYFIA